MPENCLIDMMEEQAICCCPIIVITILLTNGSIYLFVSIGGIKWELSRQLKRKEERYFTRKHLSCGITNFPKNENPINPPKSRKLFTLFTLYSKTISLFLFSAFLRTNCQCSVWPEATEKGKSQNGRERQEREEEEEAMASKVC